MHISDSCIGQGRHYPVPIEYESLMKSGYSPGMKMVNAPLLMDQEKFSFLLFCLIIVFVSKSVNILPFF